MTRRWFSLLSLLAVAALALPLTLGLGGGPVAAQTLDELRASGKVGERYDGFAVARDPSAADLVAEVNAKRRGVYEQRAAEQGVSVEAVGAVYAKEIVAQIPDGTWVLTEKDGWLRK